MENLILGMTFMQFGYFLMWASFGQLFSLAMQQVKYAPKIQRYGGFSIITWLNENFWRIVLTICAMVAGVAFTPQLTGAELNEFTAFLAGFTTDKIIDSLMNRKK